MRGLFVLALGAITLLSAIQTMTKQSAMIGFAALAATTLAFVAASAFLGSYYARREKKYSAFDLAGIGAIAAMFAFGAFALAYWSGFQINVAGYAVMDGFYWLLIAMVVGAFVVRKIDALDGAAPIKTNSASLMESWLTSIMRKSPAVAPQLCGEQIC